MQSILWILDLDRDLAVMTKGILRGLNGELAWLEQVAPAVFTDPRPLVPPEVAKGTSCFFDDVDAEFDVPLPCYAGFAPAQISFSVLWGNE